MKLDVYVRGQDARGRWRSLHVTDLTEESFRMFITQKLCEVGLFVGVKSKGDYVYKSDKVIKDDDES